MSKKSKKKGFEYDPEWAKAKQVCRLNMEDIRMAKELGISPRSLMKNNPSKSQPWKLPVKLWIRDLYDKMLERREAKLARKQVADSGLPASSPQAAPKEIACGIGFQPVCHFLNDIDRLEACPTANEVTAAPVTKRVEHSDQSCLVGDRMDEPSGCEYEPSRDEAAAHSLDDIPF